MYNLGSDEDNLLNITIENNSTANYSITGIDLNNTGKFYPHYTIAYILVRIKIIIYVYKSMCTKQLVCQCRMKENKNFLVIKVTWSMRQLCFYAPPPRFGWISLY
jgi:hypothetical protein